MSEEEKNLLDTEKGVFSPKYGVTGDITDVATTASCNEDTPRTEDVEPRWRGWLRFIVHMIVFVGVFVVAVAMVVVGSKYIDSCPETRMIPLFLVVGGACIILIYLISLTMVFHRAYVKARKQEEEIGTSFLIFIGCYAFGLGITAIFLGIWILVGAVYVYKAYQPDFREIECNTTLYAFSFWLLNSSIVFCIAFSVFYRYCLTTS